MVTILTTVATVPSTWLLHRPGSVYHLTSHCKHHCQHSSAISILYFLPKATLVTLVYLTNSFFCPVSAFILLSFFCRRSDVGVNSIECSQCKLWVHKKCSGLTGRLVADPEFICQRCRGVACPIDGRPVTHVDVDGTLCYLGDMFSAGGGCDHTIAARCCAAWGKFRKLLPILISKHYQRYP